MGENAKAVRLRRFGGPEVLEIESVQLPQIGEDEVLLDVHWIGLNRAEVLFREGVYMVRPDLPAPIGMECEGVVIEVGEKVRKLRPGDRVGAIPGTFDVRKYGCYGDRIILPGRSLLSTPEDLTGPQAGAVWMAYLTVWGGMLAAGGLEEGWTVVISAASSSCGIAAIQMALQEGAHPIAVTTHAAKAEALRKLGAEKVIVSTAEDVAAKVLEFTDGKGAELFFDAVGGSFLQTELRCLAPQGRIILYGILDQRPAAVEAVHLIARGARIEGYFLPNTTRNPETLGIAEQYIVEGIGGGTLRPVVSQVFPLQEIQEAHRYLESGGQVGKVVVQVG